MVIRTRAPRGLTLVELLITFVMLLFLVGVMTLMTVRSKTVFQGAAAHSAARQDLQTVLMKIAQEVKSTHKALITDGSAIGKGAFSFMAATDSNGRFITAAGGSLVWQKYVIYYIPAGTTTLLRREVYRDFTDPATNIPLTASELATLCNGTGTTVMKTAQKVSLTPDSNATMSAAILHLQTETVNQHGKRDTQSADLTVLLYNLKRK
ncbi:MAG: hypothetical protein RDV48_25515 [Candidatus Eremiobacteraeota bacterium]|nr:hypothetical protein [Candidatus Eremiobacteraeota bacterium]